MNIANFLRTAFYRTPPVAASERRNGDIRVIDELAYRMRMTLMRIVEKMTPTQLLFLRKTYIFYKNKRLFT